MRRDLFFYLSSVFSLLTVTTSITNRDYVSAEQERYSLLLKRYLESRYAKPLARFMFPRLVVVREWLFGDFVSVFLSNVLSEIFSIKTSTEGR